MSRRRNPESELLDGTVRALRALHTANGELLRHLEGRIWTEHVEAIGVNAQKQVAIAGQLRQRLKELRAACKADHARVGDAQCNAVAEATRQRFMRPSPSPYANDPVKPAPPPAGDRAP